MGEPMTTRATRWSLTIWMPPHTREGAQEMIVNAVNQHIGWSVEGQVEKGAESGKLHLQLMLKTPQCRKSIVCKAFPSVHVESARNPEALANYVHKEDTREGEFKTIENKLIQFKDVRNEFFEWIANEIDFEMYPQQSWEERMEYWDKFISKCIVEGKEVDLIGVNPQYRSCIGKYWHAYVRRQTDRQTEEEEKNISVDRQTDKTKISVAKVVNYAC